MSDWRRRTPDALAALAVLVLGIAEIAQPDVYSTAGMFIVVLGFAAAVGLARSQPAIALVLVWLTGSFQLLNGTPVLVVEVAVAYIAFACARWGNVATVGLSGLSIPTGIAVVVAAAVVDVTPYYYRYQYGWLSDAAYRFGDTWQAGAAVVVALALVAPWLLGLALRFMARARRSEASEELAQAEAAQAQEIARLREEQAQLARDVHDVVGHSLAVILAQAESAQYLDDVDTQGLKRTMANIATSARGSLDDVRQVLASTSGETAAQVRHADLDSLVEGVRASGHQVVSTEVGVPQPMPPELEVVAYRVLQEMLTNAIKHGPRDRPVRVERHWEGDLRIEVQNALDTSTSIGTDETQPLVVPPAPGSTGGQGVDGMRRRLESVGGRLDVRRRADPPTFTATAWVPVRVR